MFTYFKIIVHDIQTLYLIPNQNHMILKGKKITQMMEKIPKKIVD
jgi:hypothetical protein